MNSLAFVSRPGAGEGGKYHLEFGKQLNCKPIIEEEEEEEEEEQASRQIGLGFFMRRSSERAQFPLAIKMEMRRGAADLPPKEDSIYDVRTPGGRGSGKADKRGQ